MVVDNEGNIVLFNRAAEEMTGYRKEEVIGKKSSLFHCEMEPNMAEVEPDSQLEKFGARYNMECRIRSGDGRAVASFERTLSQ